MLYSAWNIQIEALGLESSQILRLGDRVITACTQSQTCYFYLVLQEEEKPATGVPQVAADVAACKALCTTFFPFLLSF